MKFPTARLKFIAKKKGFCFCTLRIDLLFKDYAHFFKDGNNVKLPSETFFVVVCLSVFQPEPGKSLISNINCLGC